MDILYIDRNQLLQGTEATKGYMVIGLPRLITSLTAIFTAHHAENPHRLALDTLRTMATGNGYALNTTVPGLQLIVSRQPFRDVDIADMHTYFISTVGGSVDLIWEPLISLQWADDEWYPAIESLDIVQRFTPATEDGRVSLDMLHQGGVFDQIKTILNRSMEDWRILAGLAALNHARASMEYGDGLEFTANTHRLRARVGQLAPVTMTASSATVPTWDRTQCYLFVNALKDGPPTLVFEWVPPADQGYFSLSQLRNVREEHDFVWKALHALRRELAA